MSKHLLRTRFAEDIVAEFLQPAKPSNKVVVLCYGMPGMPNIKSTMQFIAKRGYWVFLPRYRGTWESGGTFLDHSPHEDILDVIGELDKSFTSLWDGTEYTIENPEIYVVGSSFGGPAAILCSSDPRVKKAVATAPVVDWAAEAESPAEPMDWLGPTVKAAFGEGYRFSMEDWQRLADGKLYNPVDHADEVDPSKLLIIHAMDDDVVLYGPVKAFADKVGCKMISTKKGGHFGSRTLLKWGLRGKIWKFIES